ncbi:MAG: response regulator transcription factor [Chitinophagales bacterium]
MLSRILLVEDEETLLQAIRLNLELEGYEVEVAETGTKAIKKAREQRFNLIVLDVMLPEMDGFAVCENIRLTDTHTPILFLTAKDSGQDRVNGLKLGANDYLPKPFNLEEFLLRVKNLVKQSQLTVTPEADLDKYTFGGNEVNFVTFEARSANGSTYHLTKKEVALLKLLIGRKNTVVSRQHILEHVWGYDVYPSTRTVDNFILAFRKYFEKDARDPHYFHSIRGVGYKFTE